MNIAARNALAQIILLGMHWRKWTFMKSDTSWLYNSATIQKSTQNHFQVTEKQLTKPPDLHRTATVETERELFIAPDLQMYMLLLTNAKKGSKITERDWLWLHEDQYKREDLAYLYYCIGLGSMFDQIHISVYHKITVANWRAQTRVDFTSKQRFIRPIGFTRSYSDSMV